MSLDVNSPAAAPASVPKKAPRTINPVESFAFTYIASPLRAVYDVLYFSGTMGLLVCWHYYYPTYARWRHANIYRYRKQQSDFIRAFCLTKNFPKVYQPDEVRPHLQWIKLFFFIRVIQGCVFSMPALPELPEPSKVKE
jgi:hypothetical protein